MIKVFRVLGCFFWVVIGFIAGFILYSMIAGFYAGKKSVDTLGDELTKDLMTKK